MFSVMKRRALLLPTGPVGSGAMHLFVILTDPVGPRGVVILVSISSVRPNRKYDKTCLIDEGEHEFIKHQSYVLYESCQERCAPDLEQGVKSGLFMDKGCINAKLFERIIAGVARSRFTPLFINDYI